MRVTDPADLPRIARGVQRLALEVPADQRFQLVDTVDRLLAIARAAPDGRIVYDRVFLADLRA